MRIISGEAKGRRLKSPRSRGVRPTVARARQALFDSLAARLPGSRFLDLFAGVGTVGLEALSRGAAFALFVERNARACGFIRQTLEELGWKQRAQVWQRGASGALSDLEEEQFDIIFLDPPYQWLAETVRTLETLGRARGPAGPETIVIAQHHWKAALPERVGDLENTETRRTGDTAFSFYSRLATDAPATIDRGERNALSEGLALNEEGETCREPSTLAASTP
jgi:16S rRNA (guanine(966)-N(2))-methyltransferase RsmD